jgi:hypothetical protein
LDFQTIQGCLKMFDQVIDCLALDDQKELMQLLIKEIRVNLVRPSKKSEAPSEEGAFICKLRTRLVEVNISLCEIPSLPVTYDGGEQKFVIQPNWLPSSERFSNFFDLAFWIDLSRLHKGEFFVWPIEPADAEPTAPPKEPTMPVVNPVKQAFILKDLLEQGTCATQADLAEHRGISRARVTQTLNLLKLAPEILDALLNLPDNQACLFSERRLRPITQISSPKKQTAAFRKMCARSQANGAFPRI